MAHAITEVQAREKIRGYLKIMVYLTVLTVIELFIPKIPIKSVVGLLLTVFAVWKAAIVGWHYMHLNHETKWLRAVALTPIIAAIYAGVLMLEAPTRVNSEYPEGRARVLPGSKAARDSVEGIYSPLVDETNDKAKESGH